MSFVDDLHLAFIQTQLPPPPPRITSRTREINRKHDATTTTEQPLPLKTTNVIMHTDAELSLFAAIDAMPVMQPSKRTRARNNMSARPRVLEKQQPQPKVSRRPPLSIPAPPTIINRNSKRKSKSLPPATAAKKPLIIKRAVASAVCEECDIITALTTVDVEMKETALQILVEKGKIQSEPTLPIHTAIRIVLEASLRLGRPYDTNMLAVTFGITRSLVMQALRKYYENLAHQSEFTEFHFIPTYLWIYGISFVPAVEQIKSAIEKSGASQPGCRSVFAIARDFVMLYITEVLHENPTTPPDGSGVPPVFIEMTNAFQYRARMTGRQVLKQMKSINTIAELFGGAHDD